MKQLNAFAKDKIADIHIMMMVHNINQKSLSEKSGIDRANLSRILNYKQDVTLTMYGRIVQSLYKLIDKHATL
jgi:antitoxin component HigA of HigAB toxin-antitoxin module